MQAPPKNRNAPVARGVGSGSANLKDWQQSDSELPAAAQGSNRPHVSKADGGGAAELKQVIAGEELANFTREGNLKHGPEVQNCTSEKTSLDEAAKMVGRFSWIAGPDMIDVDQLLDDLIALWRHRRVLAHRLRILELRSEFDVLAVIDGEEHDQLAAEIKSFTEICRALAASVRGQRAETEPNGDRCAA